MKGVPPFYPAPKPPPIVTNAVFISALLIKPVCFLVGAFQRAHASHFASLPYCLTLAANNAGLGGADGRESVIL